MFKHATVALSLLACSSAFAAEENLSFKLLVKPLDVKLFEMTNIPGQQMMSMKAFGAAFFSDGRVAAKDFMYTNDTNKGSGHFSGYSTYVFEDGSSISAAFQGKLEAGKPYHGDYTVLSGTGKYSGVRGTGGFDYTPTKFEGSSLHTGSFKLTTP